jgi:hypothetical protein
MNKVIQQYITKTFQRLAERNSKLMAEEKIAQQRQVDNVEMDVDGDAEAAKQSFEVKADVHASPADTSEETTRSDSFLSPYHLLILSLLVVP